MGANFFQKKFKNEKGQALFEMLAFMPVLILMYTIIFNVGNSINVAINQQKVTRRYFYYLIKGNSLIPYQGELQAYKNSFTQIGISMVGFGDKFEGGGAAAGEKGNPLGSCFKFNSFAAGNTDETCEEPEEEEGKTGFVRVFTAYGVCGEFYTRRGSVWVPAFTEGPGNPDPKSLVRACTVSSSGP